MDRFNYLPNHKYYNNTDGVILDSNGKALRGYSISGENIGDYDEGTGKYKISIKLSGKNLFNYSAVDNDNLINCVRGYFTRNVTTITKHQNACTIFIPCKPNTTYTASRSTEYSNFHFGYTVELPAVDVVVLGAKSADNRGPTLTIETGDDAKYLVVYIYNGFSEPGALPEILQSIQIEEGATATEYEPYKGNTYNIYLDAPLTGVIDSTLDKTLPAIETNNGYNNIMVCTSKQPDDALWQYYKQ